MNILDGRQLFKKRQAAQQTLVLQSAFKATRIGMVASIADAIENKNTVKSRKAIDSAFKKIYFMTKQIQARKNGEGAFTEAETEVFTGIGNAVKEGAWSLLKAVGSSLFGAFFKAVRLAIVPVFRIFTLVVGSTLRLLVGTPQGLAVTALLAASYGAYRAYKGHQEKYYGPAQTNVQGTPTPVVPEAPTSTGTGAPVPAPTSTGAGVSPAAPAPGAAPSFRKNEKEGNRQVREIIIEAAKRNRVPADLALQISYNESGWNPKAGGMGGSSAGGLFGVIKSVWTAYGGKQEDRGDPVKDADIGTRIIFANAQGLRKGLGREPTYAEVYLSQYFGPGVVKALPHMNPSESMYDWLLRFQKKSHVDLIMEQNTNLKNKTLGEFMSVINKKMGVPTKTWDLGLAENPSAVAGVSKQETTTTKPVTSSTKATGSFVIPAAGIFTSPFGPRSIMVQGKLSNSTHSGIDIAGPLGTPVYAADGGVVAEASTFGAGGYGTKVVIDHGNGFRSLYGHSRKLLIREGDPVYKGQQITEMGSEGHSSGSHLHFEIQMVTGKSVTRVDPAAYLPGFPKDKNSRITEKQVQDSVSAEKDYVKIGKNIVRVN